MSTVKIGLNEQGSYSLLLEGHDISHLVAQDGIEISFSTRLNRRLCDPDIWSSYPTVRITLAEGLEVDIDLPDAVVETLRPDDEASV